MMEKSKTPVMANRDLFIRCTYQSLAQCFGELPLGTSLFLKGGAATECRPDDKERVDFPVWCSEKDLDCYEKF